jgi:hypothetical protein
MHAVGVQGGKPVGASVKIWQRLLLSDSQHPFQQD